MCASLRRVAYSSISQCNTRLNYQFDVGEGEKVTPAKMWLRCKRICVNASIKPEIDENDVSLML